MLVVMAFQVPNARAQTPSAPDWERHYWRDFVAGAAASLLAHEPRRQFLFSSMGLNVQAAIDEAILDVPHERGSAFERGVLASGLGTALFYITIGRTAPVSDVDFMARTSSLSNDEIALIYGGVALLHTVRITRDGRYAHFFMRPAVEGGLQVGVRLAEQ